MLDCILQGGYLSDVQEGCIESQTPQLLYFSVDAIDKLEKALVVDPSKHDALWCLGNAYTSSAFLIPNLEDARGYFDKATQYFEQAFEMVWMSTRNILFRLLNPFLTAKCYLSRNLHAGSNK